MKPDRTQAFRNFLTAGKSVEAAAASAGVAPDELDAFVADLVKDRKLDSLPMAQVAFARMMNAIDTLDEICLEGEDERARVSAAKALLDFCVTSQKLRIGADVMEKATGNSTPTTVLWDFT